MSLKAVGDNIIVQKPKEEEPENAVFKTDLHKAGEVGEVVSVPEELPEGYDIVEGDLVYFYNKYQTFMVKNQSFMAMKLDNVHTVRRDDDV